MPKIYAYSSNSIYCNYTLDISRSGSTITITASGTITGNGSSSNASNNLYAHVCYNVSPANTSGTTTYVSSYGTSLGGKLIVSAPLNKTSIPTSGKTFSVSWTITDNTARTFENCALFLSSSSSSASAAAGSAYMFIGKKDSDLNVANLRYYTQTLSVAAGYTNVSNPTASSIKFNSSSATPLIVTPNASIIVSWTAGTAGTNNAIKQYEVTLNGTTKTTTTTSATFSNLNLGRGTSYKATVKSIPTISGFGPATGTESTNQVKGNSLPTAPTVTLTGGTTISGTYYIKSGNSITFSFSSTDADGHAITYYRNTTNSTSGATAITGTSWSTSTGGTYYFWAKDSLNEYSSATSKSFTVGATLTASMGATTSATTYSHNGTSYTTGGTNTISLTSTGVGTKTYSWSLIYGASSSSMTSTQSLSSTSNSCTWAYRGTNGWSKTYQIKCIVTDQLSQTSTALSSTYTIPAVSTFNTNIYNQLGTNVSTMPTANVTGSTANDFYQTVVTSLTKDTSITLTFSITSNATAGWYTGASNSTYQSSGVIPLTITNTSPATTYTLTITPTSAWGGAISPKTYTIIRTGLPRIDSNGTRYSASNISTSSPTSIKPFTESSVYNFSFLKGNMISNNNYATTSSSNTSLWLFYGGTEVQVANQGTWTTNSTTGYITVPATRGTTATAGLYNWKTNTLGLNLNSSNVVGLRIKFTDVFGQTYSIDKANYLTLNFVETPSISFSISNSVSATSGTVIREKDTITYTPNITFYNTDKAVTIKTYVYKATSVSTPSATASGWSLYSGTSSTNGVTYTPNRGTSTNSAIIYNTPITYTVGEITESKYLYFKIAITYGSTTTNSTVPAVYYVSQRHVFITLPFTATFSNNNFSYTSSLSDRGGGKITTSTSDKAAGLGTVNYGLQFSQTNDFSTYQWLNSSGSLVNTEAWRNSATGGSASYSGSNISLGTSWSFYNIRAVYQTNIGSVTKISYSSVVTIYNTAPTISYRKNQIGININGIESNHQTAAVVVGSTTGKNLIKLYSANNTATIDLDSGDLEGFVIDGGTW